MIIEWIALMVIVFAALLMIKLEHHVKTVKIFVMLISGLIIYFSVVGLLSSSDIDITSPKGIANGFYLYVGWVGNTVSSLWDIGENTVSLVGNAIKTNQTKEEKPRR